MQSTLMQTARQGRAKALEFLREKRSNVIELEVAPRLSEVRRTRRTVSQIQSFGFSADNVNQRIIRAA